MPENSSSTTGSSSWDEVDEYLYRCLDAPDESVEDRLAAACEERPDLAPALRRRFDVLRNLGFEGPTRWHADAAPGDRFGDHLLLQRIGGGGMGVVYLARQEKLGREVALKLLRGAISEEPAFRERFLREARSVSQLRHPAICRILELGEHEGTPYFSMEYVPGQSLAEFLREERAAKQARRSSSIARQDLVRRVTWLRDIALALEEAHRAGVIHRDIKPSNILIDESGQARLIDFGLAHDGASSQDLTMSGEMLGTPGYMAPEQLRGDSKRVGPETDVFGLGATLFEIVTLERPHSASGRVELIQKTLHEPISNPRSLNPRLDHELCAVIEKALEKEPPRRYRSAARFAEDLQRWLDGKPVLARRPSALRRSSRWVRRNPLPTLLGGVLLSSSLVIGYFLNDAQNSLRIARALALVDTARQANEIGEPQTAGRLAYAAYELDPTPTTLGALQQSLATIAPSQRIEAGGPVWYCAYSPDSRLVLGAGQGGKGVLASVDGTKIAELQTESTKLWCFAFGPTNDVLIGGRGEARIFDCEGALRGTIPVPENSEAFTAACFGPAGERILLGDDIGRVHVHRVEDGQRVATFARAECSVETHFDAILQLRLHPSGERFVSTDYCGSICLRELDSGKVLARHGEQPAPTDAILLPDATDQLCYADRHGHVHIWDFGKNELSRFGEDLRWYTGLAATPDGKYLAGSGYLAQVEVYRRDGQLQTVIPHDAGVWDCEFSPDGTRLATCTDSGVVRIFDLGGVLLRELRGHRASINQMRWSPDGRSILTASQDGELRIWYLDRDELPMLSGHRSEVLSVFPLRGGGFVSGDSCGMLRIWSDEGKLEKSIDTSPSRLEALAYTRHSDAFFASLTPGVIASWTAKRASSRAPVLRVQDQTLGAFASGRRKTARGPDRHQ
jgi:serine/threonine protein kinase/WD40 repeat protein